MTDNKAQSTQDEDRTKNSINQENKNSTDTTQEERDKQVRDAEAKQNGTALTQEQLDDNELKAKLQREELDRTNSEHKTDDFHTPEALREQEAYEHGQKIVNEQNAKLDSNARPGVDQ